MAAAVRFVTRRSRKLPRPCRTVAASPWPQGVLTAMWVQKSPILWRPRFWLWKLVGTGASVLGFRARAHSAGSGGGVGGGTGGQAPRRGGPGGAHRRTGESRTAGRGQEVYESMMVSYRARRLTMDEVLLWSPHLLEARTGLRQRPKPSGSRHGKHTSGRMLEYEKRVKNTVDAGRGGPRKSLKAKLLRTGSRIAPRARKARRQAHAVRMRRGRVACSMPSGSG